VNQDKKHNQIMCLLTLNQEVSFS